MAAAAIIFFAFYGFDAVSTAAEETRNPGRDLVRGIVGSMIVCTVIYIAVAAAALGALPFQDFASSAEPLAHVLRTLGSPVAANLIAAAAIVALPTVILAFLYGQSRIFFVMARDGLLPSKLGGVSARTGTPVTMTLATAIIVSLIAGFFPLAQIAELANAGTLAAFIAVAGCVMALRVLQPTRARVFRTPLVWLVGPLAVVGCVYLFFSLPEVTRTRFYIWNAIGLAVYFVYAMHSSHIGKQLKAGASGENQIKPIIRPASPTLNHAVSDRTTAARARAGEGVSAAATRRNSSSCTRIAATNSTIFNSKAQLK